MRHATPAAGPCERSTGRAGPPHQGGPVRGQAIYGPVKGPVKGQAGSRKGTGNLSQSALIRRAMWASGESMRTRRVLAEEGSPGACYHCVTRLVDRRFALGDPERETFVKILRRTGSSARGGSDLLRDEQPLSRVRSSVRPRAATPRAGLPAKRLRRTNVCEGQAIH